MLVDSTSIPLRNLQSNPPASSHGQGKPCIIGSNKTVKKF